MLIFFTPEDGCFLCLSKSLLCLCPCKHNESAVLQCCLWRTQQGTALYSVLAATHGGLKAGKITFCGGHFFSEWNSLASLKKKKNKENMGYWTESRSPGAKFSSQWPLMNPSFPCGTKYNRFFRPFSVILTENMIYHKNSEPLSFHWNGLPFISQLA